MSVWGAVVDSVPDYLLPIAIFTSVFGTGGAFAIWRQARTFQKEVTDTYIDENRKLIIALREVREEHAAAQRKILELELTVRRHELRIHEQEIMIGELSRRHRDKPNEGGP